MFGGAVVVIGPLLSCSLPKAKLGASQMGSVLFNRRAPVFCVCARMCNYSQVSKQTVHVHQTRPEGRGRIGLSLSLSLPQ